MTVGVSQADPQTQAPEAKAARPGLAYVMFVLAPVLFMLVNAALIYTWRTRSHWIFEFIRRDYQFNTIIMPSYLLFCGVIGYLCAWRGKLATQKIRLRRWSAMALGAALLCVGARLWATHIEPSLFQVRRVTINTPKLNTPLRILHITDIQSDFVGRREERAFEMMRELNPDLVVFTGDLLQPLGRATVASELPKIDRLLRSLTPRLGLIAVGGDVDGIIHHQMQAGLGGMHLLANESLEIDTGDGRLNLLGLKLQPSRAWTESDEMIANWARSAAASDFTILIGHGPDYIQTARDYPIDLCLAGHTHGGQIRLPFYGPPITFTDIPRELARGYHKVGRTHLNVSAGIGGEHAGDVPMIRVNCPPEMTLLELVPAK